MTFTLKCSLLTSWLLVQTQGEIVRFGTSAPPSDIGSFELQAFPYDSRATYSYYSTVPTGVDSDITFSRALEHRRTPNGGWSTWGHGYYGDVYYESATELTISLPPMCAFVFYLEQNKFGNFTFRVELDNGEFVDEFISAEGFGIYDSGEGMPVSLTITELSGGDSNGFAVGEFYGALGNCSEFPNTTAAITTTTDLPENIVKLGIYASPTELCGFDLEPFPYDNRATFAEYSTVATGMGTDVTFSQPLEHRRAPNGGWNTWGHGYDGDVYFYPLTEVTIGLPHMCAFAFYLVSNTYATFSFRVELNNGDFVQESISNEGSGTDSAEGFGIFDAGDGMPVSVTITELSSGDANGFAVGEFYGALGKCTELPIVSTTTKLPIVGSTHPSTTTQTFLWDDDEPSSNGSGLSGGATILGILLVAAVLVGIGVLLCFLPFLLYRFKSPATVTSNRNEPAVASGGAPMPTPTISVAPMTAAPMSGIRVFPSAAPVAAIGTQPTSMPPAYVKVAAVEPATVDVVLQGTAMTVQRDAGTETMPLTFSNASAAAVNLQPAFGDDYYGVGPVGASEYLDAAPSAPPPHYSV